MQILVKRCAEWENILSLGFEKLDNAKNIQTTDVFQVGCAKGARVLGLWGDAGEATLAGNGKATANGEGSLIVIGERACLNKTSIQINGNRSYIVVGAGCNMKGVQLQIKGDDCLIAIGAGTTWESGAAICDSGQSIVVGDDCMFSSNVILRVSDGHSLWEAGGAKRISMPRDVVIHPHVWLGNGTRVSKGATVGMGTTVGQVSLVTGRLDPFSIYGGIPARLLRRGNAEWSRTNKYEDIPEMFRATKKSIMDSNVK